MPLYQPSGIAVAGHTVALYLRHCNGRLVCYQQMERQRGQRAQGYDEELGLVLDQRLDRPEQRNVQVMRGSKIEQLGLTHRDGFRQFVDIEAATEGGDLRR